MVSLAPQVACSFSCFRAPLRRDVLLVPARRPGRTTAARSSSGLEGEEPQPPPQQTSTAPPNAGGNSADDAEAAAVGKWAEQYKCQQPASSSASTTTSSAVAPAEEFILPVMTLRDKCKAPTESVPLQIFEPRYRLLMKLVNSSASRLFGVLLRKGDKDGGELESVGALCEMTHYVAVPERRRLFINARVIGRFETRRVIASKPFVVVTAAPYGDRPAASLEAAVQAAALEMRIWEAMQDVKQLASKLYVGGGDKLTNEIFSTEVRRWSPDSAARAEVQFAAGSDPTLMRMVLLAGLLGDEATVAERTTEHLCSDALREVGEDLRRERFSFALVRTLDLGPERMQQFLDMRDSAERLRAAEELILEGRSYLAARSTLRDLF